MKFGTAVRQDAGFVADCFGSHEANFVGSADWPTPHSNVGPVIHLIEIDGIGFVFLASNFAEILSMEAILSGIPIIEGAIRFGEVGVVEVARIKGVIERGR